MMHDPTMHNACMHACVGAASKASHTIYIWDRDTGRLDKILEGPREPLLDVDVRLSTPRYLCS